MSNHAGTALLPENRACIDLHAGATRVHLDWEQVLRRAFTTQIALFNAADHGLRSDQVEYGFVYCIKTRKRERFTTEPTV